MTCVHNWKIETQIDPQGMVGGVCKNCGEVRTFLGCYEAVSKRQLRDLMYRRYPKEGRRNE